MSVVAERPAAEAVFERVLGPQWADPLWRIRSLYWIVDKDGKKVRFIPNDEQLAFLTRLWHQNLILKARQLGMSTLMALLSLDQALFNADYNAAIISDTLPNAGKLFGKVEFAYDHLPQEVRDALPLKSRGAKTSIEFAHGSSVSVGVSARGGTLQLLHVSELGKIAAKFPARAEEVVTGAFEAVPLQGVKVVESTAEGAAGAFHDLCMTAHKRQQEKVPETALDWRLHFFPWYLSRDYRLSDEDTAAVLIPEALTKYFRELETKLGITLDANQRAWYAKKRETLKRKMKQEYPSTVEEAFEVAVEGAIYADEMATVREKGRIGVVPLDPAFPVNTFWDLGARHMTFIWLHQRIGLQHRFFKTFGASGVGLAKWWHDLETYRREQRFLWGRHFLPHDADYQVLGEDIETKKQILVRSGMEDGSIVVVPRVRNITDGIESTKTVLDVACWFDREGCAEGIKALDAYQYEWDDIRGVWSRTPLDNWAADPADAFRQFAQGWTDAGEAVQSIAGFKNRVRSWR